MTHLIYIHGFNSSPQSLKAQQLLAFVQACRPDIRVQVPALPMNPEAALALLESCVQACPLAPGLIGSSMGGFFANVLAARHGLRAVLVNPAVHPHQLLRRHLGVNHNYHTGEASELRAAHVDFLQRTEVAPGHRDRIRVLLETGDETLDYRDAERFYTGCHVEIAQGGSHAFEGFQAALPSIVDFLEQSNEQ
ncbi:MAG: YqiA/YcfP family alpha/beta fold hydrolase [Moraxellaceae bacterium]|nr:YqiA/YcfP family alpha/beta fold hydrolase [Moraxellaceae bacterium]